MSALKENIIAICEKNQEIFSKCELDNDTKDFFRMKIFYPSFFKKTDHINMDINKKASVVKEPVKKKVPHFYEAIPEFEITTLDIEEFVAEKVRSLMT